MDFGWPNEKWNDTLFDAIHTKHHQALIWKLQPFAKRCLFSCFGLWSSEWRHQHRCCEHKDMLRTKKRHQVRIGGEAADIGSPRRQNDAAPHTHCNKAVTDLFTIPAYDIVWQSIPSRTTFKVCPWRILLGARIAARTYHHLPTFQKCYGLMLFWGKALPLWQTEVCDSQYGAMQRQDAVAQWTVDGMGVNSNVLGVNSENNMIKKWLRGLCRSCGWGMRYETSFHPPKS